MDISQYIRCKAKYPDNSNNIDAIIPVPVFCFKKLMLKNLKHQTQNDVE